MDQHYIDLLEFLEPHGIGVYTDISPKLQEMFPLIEKDKHLYLNHSIQRIRTLLLSMITHIDLNQIHPHNVGRSPDGGIMWIEGQPVIAFIKAEGLQFLHSVRNQKLVEVVNTSVIETNAATKELYQKQNRLYWVTLLIAALSVVFPALSYFRDNNVSVLNGMITRQKEILTQTQSSNKRLQARVDSLLKVVTVKGDLQMKPPK